MRIVLEVINCILTSNLAANPQLVRSLKGASLQHIRCTYVKTVMQLPAIQYTMLNTSLCHCS